MSEVLRAYPNDPNASYTLAIVHRMRKNPSAAIAILDKLISANPDFARAYQEKGINLLMVSEPQTAGVALEKAVAVDPSLIESWKLLVPLYKKWGSPREDEARQQVKLLLGHYKI